MLSIRAPAWAHEQGCSVPHSKKGWERLQSRIIKMTMWPIMEASGEKVKTNWILDEDTYLTDETSQSDPAVCAVRVPREGR